MPTSKPRITITLSEHQHGVLKRMAMLGKSSMSEIVVDMVDTMVPVLERVVSAMQAAHDAPKELHEGMRKTLEKAEQDMEPLLSQVMGQLDMLETVTGAPVRAAAAPPSPSQKSPRPPPTNRGVRIPSKTSKNTALSPMKTTSTSRGVKK